MKSSLTASDFNYSFYGDVMQAYNLYITQIAHHTLQPNVSNNLYLCSAFRTRPYIMDMVMTWQVQTFKYDYLKYGFPF